MSLAAMVLADRGERMIRYYDRWIGFVTGGRDREVRAAVLREVRPGDRLLDVGCGTGSLAIEAARAGARVTGVDRSSAMLAVARDKAARAGVSVELREADAAAPVPGERPFDVATATFVLGELSLDEATLAVRRLAEAVRAGGLVVIADEVAPPSRLARVAAAVPRALLWIIAFFVLQQYAPTRRHPWQRLLEEAGLVVDERRTVRIGSLVVLVTRRPPVLPEIRRGVLPLEEAIARGARGMLLRVAAWLALPIAVRPGLYTVGAPNRSSPLLLTGNFLGSVDAVRSALRGRDAWLIVEDSGGWNVWCAADAGLFSAGKAAALMELHRAAELVDHRRIVIPRLGGRIRGPLAAQTGFEVAVGPVDARDLPTFLATSEITAAMRSLPRLYRLPERVRVGALTLVQLPVFLLPLRFMPQPLRRPAWRFALAASVVLPLAHDRLPGATGVAKATGLGLGGGLAGLLTGRLRLGGAATLLAVAPLVGWIYQSSSPVVFWKRFWR
jgi:2-polyprenyl-3-methyl-5-hydroxy-6-metoxy-1,4-benzoquinol methylase